MKKKLKVKEAISMGRKLVIFPVSIIVFSITASVYYFVATGSRSNWALPFAFVLSLIPGWFCWRFIVARWKSWAYPKVKNTYQFEKQAAQEKLFLPDFSFLSKSGDKGINADLIISEEDNEIPDETVIYYSKAKNIYQMYTMFVCMFFGMMILLISIDGYLIIFIGAILAFVEFKQATNTEAQIVINNKGIRTIRTDLKSWKEIEHEEVVFTGGRGGGYYLAYGYPGGSEKLKIDDFNIEVWQMEVLLRVYRGRYNV